MKVILPDTRVSSADFLAAQDSFARQMAQTKSLLIALSGDDQFSTMSAQYVSGVLWLLLDCLDELNESHHKLVSSVSGD